MLLERTDQQHNVEDNVAEDSSSQRLTLTRTLSSGVSATESIAYQDGIPEDTISDNGKANLETTSVSWIPVKYLILLCGFLTSLSFGVTQVPLLYVFRLMTCDGYYKSHPSRIQDSSLLSMVARFMMPSDDMQPMLSYIFKASIGDDDRCSIQPIETSTALSISLLGASTTVFGIVNLFLTGSLIKRIGVQRALIIQVFFPAVRLLIQNVGVEVWDYTGILIVQCSQVASIIGGPSGYILALNQFITEAVSSEQRTAALGRLAGTMLFGSAFGFLIGGVLAEEFGIKAPFRLTLTLFLCSAAFVMLFLPYVPPPASTSMNNTTAEHPGVNQSVKRDQKPKNKFFGPLLVFFPQKYVLKNGQVQTEYGAFLLACGVFLGIVATGYLPTLLQLYSTDVFKFGTKQNGWLIFMYSMLRGLFLTFVFPEIIALGRKSIARREAQARKSETGQHDSPVASEQQPLLADQSNKTQPNEDTGQAATRIFTFDLTYTRLSIAADGILTLLCTFLHDGWQMYLVAAILPFAAGTGSAAKGTVLQIAGATSSSEERTDALAGISLVENMARLTTAFVFGVVFAGFTNLGRPELVFTVNAACALVAFFVLLFARFPPEGSIRYDSIDRSAGQEQTSE